MADQVQICNLALYRIGGRKIEAFIEDSEESQACQVFYDQVRKEVLEDDQWEFATVIKPLSKLEGRPSCQWAYRYSYPTDCLQGHTVVPPCDENSPALNQFYQNPQQPEPHQRRCGYSSHQTPEYNSGSY